MASSSSAAAVSVVSSGAQVSSSSAMSSGGSSPCAACKFLRRKCQPDCVFAPYFPPDNQLKFVHVHRVFGASNVTKLLNELHPFQREDAVNSLAYEADMRLQDPVYGCVGVISLLQHQLRQLTFDLQRARSELSKYQQQAAVVAGIGHCHADGYVNVAGAENFFPPTDNDVSAAQFMLMRGSFDSDQPATTTHLGSTSSSLHGGILESGIGSSGFPLGQHLAGGHFLKPSTAGNDEASTIGL